ncbi:hypothetical protein KAR34_04795 [bacterium]|nr:hypothetical protein [bacterium]
MARPKKTNRSAKVLPVFLRPLFWEYDFKKISWPADKNLIVSRILREGDWQAIVWLRKNTNTIQLRQWFWEHQGRGLDSRRLRYWELVLNLPRKYINNWMHPKDGGIWQGRHGT